jgi:hypothetical protein
MYNDVCNENSHILTIQLSHYMDEGCRCGLCLNKRRSVVLRLMKGDKINERVNHEEEVKNEKLRDIKRSVARTVVSSRIRSKVELSGNMLQNVDLMRR